MITQRISVPSTAEERYNDDFPSQVLKVLRSCGVEATDIGGGSDLNGNADNDFRLSGDEVGIARAKAAVRDRFRREIRVWADNEIRVWAGN